MPKQPKTARCTPSERSSRLGDLGGESRRHGRESTPAELSGGARAFALPEHPEKTLSKLTCAYSPHSKRGRDKLPLSGGATCGLQPAVEMTRGANLCPAS